MPVITSIDEDFQPLDPNQDDAKHEVSKVLVNHGSSVNLLYWKTFRRMDISEDLIVPYNEQIVGFFGEGVKT